MRSRRDSNPHLPPSGGRSFYRPRLQPTVPLAHHTPQVLWIVPPQAYRELIMSKSQSYMLYGRYHCRFRSYSSLGSRGQLRLSPPGSRCLVTPPALAMRDLLQVCRLRLSCCQHVKELCCVPQGGLALSILPGHGRHCSYATAVALIARGHEVDQTSECA